MRLKEIKPGMVIHCKTKEEMEQLSKHIKFFNTVDNIWSYGNDGVSRDCIRINEMGKYEGFCTYDYYANEMRYKITEFSDLILPELTAEELLQVINDICNTYSNYSCDCKKECPFSNGYCKEWMAKHPKDTIEICAQWKSSHEKKEPEIETVDICRIIEIQPDGRKRCVHEEDLASGSTYAEIKILVEAELKQYISKHNGKFIAVHEVVSRVKEV